MLEAVAPNDYAIYRIEDRGRDPVEIAYTKRHVDEQDMSPEEADLKKEIVDGFCYDMKVYRKRSSSSAYLWALDILRRNHGSVEIVGGIYPLTQVIY